MIPPTNRQKKPKVGKTNTPFYMTVKYPYAKLHRYPHLGTEDIKIWERFIDAHKDRFDEVYYDLPVGKGAAVPDKTQQNMVDDWAYLTKYKCDVVAYKNGKCYIIEIKPRAGLASIGQVINYGLLYQEYVDQSTQPRLIIATDEIRTDMDWLCDEWDIELVVV